jgi:hypothetical protein
MLFNSAPQVVKIRINPCNAISDQFKFRQPFRIIQQLTCTGSQTEISIAKLMQNQEEKSRQKLFKIQLNNLLSLWGLKQVVRLLKDDEWMTMTGDENGDDSVSAVSTYTQSKCHPNPARLLLRTVTEPVISNVYGAQESIPRNEFRQPM